MGFIETVQGMLGGSALDLLVYAVILFVFILGLILSLIHI